MAITISDAIRLIDEGIADYKKGIVKAPHEADTPQFRWWAKGWTEQHQIAIKGGKNACTHQTEK